MPGAKLLREALAARHHRARGLEQAPHRPDARREAVEDRPRQPRRLAAQPHVEGGHGAVERQEAGVVRGEDRGAFGGQVLVAATAHAEPAPVEREEGRQRAAQGLGRDAGLARLGVRRERLESREAPAARRRPSSAPAGPARLGGNLLARGPSQRPRRRQEGEILEHRIGEVDSLEGIAPRAPASPVGATPRGATPSRRQSGPSGGTQSATSRAGAADARLELLGDGREGAGAAVGGGVLEDREAPRLRLVDPHVVAEHRRADLLREALLQAFEDLVGEARAAVEGGHHHRHAQLPMAEARCAPCAAVRSSSAQPSRAR